MTDKQDKTADAGFDPQKEHDERKARREAMAKGEQPDPPGRSQPKDKDEGKE